MESLEDKCEIFKRKHSRLDRVADHSEARDLKGVLSAFNESVRIRESVFRFGEVRTILTLNPQNLGEELFARYVRMEEPVLHDARPLAV